jgi:dienelactone hydrolase
MRCCPIIAFAVCLLLLTTACPQARSAGGAGSAAPAVNALDRGAATQPGAQVGAQGLAPAPKGANAVWLTTSDKYRIAAWYYPSKGKACPGVILLHQRGKDKSSWGSLPGKLTEEGYCVLAIDLRGHGESLDPSGAPIALNSLGDPDYQAMLNDVKAAHEFLAAQKGVAGDRIGIIGASIGANLAIIYSAGDRNVRAVVALSPGLNYKSLQPLPAMTALDKRPLFLIASKGDAVSFDCIQKLRDAAVKEEPVSFRAFDGSAHGTEILAAQEGLDTTIASGWMLNYLPPASPPPT